MWINHIAGRLILRIDIGGMSAAVVYCERSLVVNKTSTKNRDIRGAREKSHDKTEWSDQATARLWFKYKDMLRAWTAAGAELISV